MAYATVAQLREYLDQVQNSTAKDDLLTNILARATSVIDGALGFSFAGYTTGQRRVRSENGPLLLLPPHELGSVTEVADLSSNVVDAGYYEQTEGGNLKLLMDVVFPAPVPWDSYTRVSWTTKWGYGDFLITANWGYGPAPESIVQLCLELAVNTWRSKDKGLFTESIGVETGGSIRYVGGLNKIQQQIIKDVKRRYLDKWVTI